MKIKANLKIINNSGFLLPYLIILISVILNFVFNTSEENFHMIFYQNISSILNNICFFMALMLIINILNNNIFNSYEQIIRKRTYSNTIISNIKAIIMYSLFFYILYILLILSGSIITSFGNCKLLLHENYNINMIFFNMYSIIKNYILILEFTILLYLISKINKKYGLSLMILYILLFFIPTDLSKINHFYNMSILVQKYMTNGIFFINFLTELISIIIYICIIFLIIIVLYKNVTQKKRDIL
ncbi:MAG: hypothetical protein SPI44_02345 [Bacilli bacterium]|nr:hypothetical protein [Bacilli bacterium]